MSDAPKERRKRYQGVSAVTELDRINAESAARASASIKLSPAAMRDALSAEQLRAVMLGVAGVISASPSHDTSALSRRPTHDGKEPR